MSPDELAEIEAALLCISEARERAERLARELKRSNRDGDVVDALEAADRELLAVHGDLMRRAYFGESPPCAEQLKLAG